MVEDSPPGGGRNVDHPFRRVVLVCLELDLKHTGERAARIAEDLGHDRPPTVEQLNEVANLELRRRMLDGADVVAVGC
jgi:hypothetical protein